MLRLERTINLLCQETEGGGKGGGRGGEGRGGEGSGGEGRGGEGGDGRGGEGRTSHRAYAEAVGCRSAPRKSIYVSNTSRIT